MHALVVAALALLIETPAPPVAPAPVAAAPAAQAAPAAGTPPTSAPAPAPETSTPADALASPASPAAPDAPAAKRVKLLILDVKSADLGTDQRETLTSVLASRATRFPIDVVTTAEVRELAALSADKAAAGCEEDAASCMAELAGALGADLVLSSRAGKLDAVFVVTLQIFDARTGSAQGRTSVEAWTLSDLPEKLGPALDAMLTSATGEQPSSGPVVDNTPSGPPAGLATGLLIGGGVAAGVGVVSLALGVIPAVQYSNKKQDLVVRTDAFTGTEQELTQATRIHKDAVDARELYNGVGRWGVAAGALLVVVGGAAVGVSFLVPTEGAE